MWGGIGALAPEVVRLHTLVTAQGSPLLPTISLFYVTASLAFIAVGGLFAVAWNDDNPVKCLYIGASLPVIVSAWGQSPPPPAVLR